MCAMIPMLRTLSAWAILEIPPEEIERRGAGDRAVGEQRLQDLPDLPLGDVPQVREEVPDPRGADLVERPRRGKRLGGTDGGSPLFGLDDETLLSRAYHLPPDARRRDQAGDHQGNG